MDSKTTVDAVDSRWNLYVKPVGELHKTEIYWYVYAQQTNFLKDIDAIKSRCSLSKASPVLSLRPFIDSSGLMRVGGRQQLSLMSFSQEHPIILHHKHPLTHLIVCSEHVRLLHAGPTLLSSSIGSRYHILGYRKLIRSITRGCVTCRKLSAKPSDNSQSND